jgi:hypothetical protein
LRDIVAVLGMTIAIGVLIVCTAVIAGTWVGIAAAAMDAWLP